MSFMLKSFVICPFTYTQDGQTALYIAAEKDNNECVQLLIKASANPDIADYVSCDMHFMVYSLKRMVYNIYNVLKHFLHNFLFWKETFCILFNHFYVIYTNIHLFICPFTYT